MLVFNMYVYTILSFSWKHKCLVLVKYLVFVIQAGQVNNRDSYSYISIRSIFCTFISFIIMYFIDYSLIQIFLICIILNVIRILWSLLFVKWLNIKYIVSGLLITMGVPWNAFLTVMSCTMCCTNQSLLKHKPCGLYSIEVIMVMVWYD